MRLPRSKVVKADDKTKAIKYPAPKYHLAGALGSDHDLLEQKKPVSNKKQQGQGQTQGQNSGKAQIDGKQQKNQYAKQDGKLSYTQRQNKNVRQFVKPWNPNVPHTSKSGNQLTKDFEEWMKGFCHRCGYSNHIAKECRTYPSNTTVLTLCMVCCQGLHVDCKSKRKDILMKKEYETTREALTDEVKTQVKKVFNLYSLNQRAQNAIQHAPKVPKKTPSLW